MLSSKAVLGAGLVASLLTAPPARASLSDGDCCQGAHASGDAGEFVVGVLAEFLIRGLFAVVEVTGTHRDPEPDDDAPGVARPRRHAAPLSFRMGGEGLVLSNESRGGDFSVGLDVEQFGISARLLGVALKADAESSAHDELVLEEVHVAWAILVTEYARVRAELGVSAAQAPGVALFGPSLGVSVEGCVAGPLDGEVRMQMTPVPYQQVDAQAGLALHLGGLVMRGGLRGLYLDDSGRLGDSLSQRRAYFGPYLGGGFNF